MTGTDLDVYDTCDSTDVNTTCLKVLVPSILEYRWVDEGAVECS